MFSRRYGQVERIDGAGANGPCPAISWQCRTICLIFGLQILVVMQSAGGPEAFSMVASEGMQSP